LNLNLVVEIPPSMTDMTDIIIIIIIIAVIMMDNDGQNRYA